MEIPSALSSKQQSSAFRERPTSHNRLPSAEKPALDAEELFGEDFAKKVLEVQHQQLQKAQYFNQITYSDTEYCHRFVNFEV
jgi:hypothetical protein